MLIMIKETSDIPFVFIARKKMLQTCIPKSSMSRVI